MTRHFHATALIVIGALGLFFLSLALGKAPHFSAPHPANTTTVTVSPTPAAQTSFVYADNSGSYQSISSFTLQTLQKNGIYGTPVTPDTSYAAFYLYANQVFLQGLKSAGIVNLGSHFFYPISLAQVPFSVSPSHTKALFLTSSTDPRTRITTNHFSLQTTSATKSAALVYPAIVGNTPQPVCWSQDENTVVFTNPQKSLFFYSLNKQTAMPATLSATLSHYTHVYCNSFDNTLYFTTPAALYKQTFTAATPTQLPASPSVLSQIPLFSQSVSDTVLVASKGALMQVDLAKNTSKELYTATDSATLVPYLWQGSTIVYTQQNVTAENGQYYLAGKVLDTSRQIDTVFARHQSASSASLGTIAPIGWLEK